MTTAHAAFAAVRDELRTILLERDTAITNALLALLTGQHLLLLGPPGTGKSLLVREVTARLTGAVYFEKLMSQFTVPEELFGPIDLVGYADHGTYRRIPKGSLSEAHTVFLDEIWKANSTILNALLGIMNERVLHEVGLDPQPVPLLSLFGASNETPQDDTLKALDDRFLLREIVGYISDDQAFIRMLGIPETRPAPQATLSGKQLQLARNEVEQVTSAPDVLQGVVTIKHRLAEQGVLVSDRKWKQCPLLLRAHAWLDGRDRMDMEDLCILRFVLWAVPKEIKTVEMTIYQLANPLYLRALEIEDQVEDLLGHLPPEDDGTYQSALENILAQLKDQHQLLKQEITASAARDTSRADASLATVAGHHQRLAQRMLKQVSRFTLEDTP
jgi:MoxR-like ATPase